MTSPLYPPLHIMERETQGGEVCNAVLSQAEVEDPAQTGVRLDVIGGA
jgi:hypothetical protein